MRQRWIFSLTFPLFLCIPALAWACRSTWVITEIGVERLTHLSFFAGLTVASSLVLNKMTAFYRKDFPKLPKLGFLKSFMVVIGAGVLLQLTLSPFMDTRQMTESPKLLAQETTKSRSEILLELSEVDPAVPHNKNLEFVYKELQSSK